MNKQEVIEILEKKRETALDNSEYYRDKENEKYEKMNRARVDSYTLAIQLVEQIEELQAEKVEVPDFVANYIETEKRRGSASIDEVFSPGFVNEWDEVNKWLYDNPTEENERRYLMAIRAYVDGYTVKPKRWVVKAVNKKYFISLAYGSGIGNLAECSAKTKEDAYQFDEKSKAEAVATLVEGSVEEV